MPNLQIKKCTALVIGINEYENYPKLKCAVHDAEELGTVLQSLKFEVDFCLNESKENIGIHIENFEESIASQKYDLALFFFAGHGCIANKSDCLLLKEAPCLTCNSEVKVKNKSIILEDLCKKLRGAGDQINIFIIDTCRSEISRSTASDFDFGKNMHIPYQTFIAYSTSPGASAKDGKIHSPYTQSLLNHIQTEDLPIERLFKLVRKEIHSTVNQLSWENSCLIEDFCFNYGQNNPSSDLPYSLNALADKNYMSSNTDAQSIIELLKEYDYSKQEKALDRFKKMYKSFSDDDKFVIGRNILQSAVGGCFKCIGEMTYTNMCQYNMENRNPVLDGILYEVYFDSNNNFRNKNLKGTRFINEIGKITFYEEFKSSVLFMRKVLNPYKEKLYYMPGDKNNVNSVRIVVKENGKDDILGNVSWNLESVIIYSKSTGDDENITTYFSAGWRPGNKQEFIERLSQLLCVPTIYMKPVFSKDVQAEDIIDAGSVSDGIM